jgi:hypothetical protein
LQQLQYLNPSSTAPWGPLQSQRRQLKHMYLQRTPRPAIAPVRDSFDLSAIEASHSGPQSVLILATRFHVWVLQTLETHEILPLLPKASLSVREQMLQRRLE